MLNSSSIIQVMQTKSSNNEQVIKKKLETLGSRETAVWLIDHFLAKETHVLCSAELPDTATFANGLDAIEECFDDQDYKGAINIAKETAQEMLEDEGY